MTSPEQGESPLQKLARGFAVASTLGVAFAAQVGIGIWVGWRCDQALGWPPIGCTIAGGMAGGVSGIVFIVKSIAVLDARARSRGGAAGRSGDVKSGDGKSKSHDGGESR